MKDADIMAPQPAAPEKETAAGDAAQSLWDDEPVPAQGAGDGSVRFVSETIDIKHGASRRSRFRHA